MAKKHAAYLINITSFLLFFYLPPFFTFYLFLNFLNQILKLFFFLILSFLHFINLLLRYHLMITIIFFICYNLKFCIFLFKVSSWLNLLIWKGLICLYRKDYMELIMFIINLLLQCFSLPPLILYILILLFDILLIIVIMEINQLLFNQKWLFYDLHF